jgi:hypothetical protein
MAAPGGRIRRRWLRARTVETVRGWRSNWEAGVASVASPSPPLLAAQVAGSDGSGRRGS